jgi:putative PIN family toxin of toxin-antitoxin system
MIKIVLDTNLLIDGSGEDFSFGNRIIEEVLKGKLSAFANRQTLAENRLMARKKITDQGYLEKLEKFFEVVIMLEGNIKLDIVEDREDNKILASGVESNASFLVTSDRHLLKLESYGDLKIVSPGQFWSIYEQETGSAWKSWIGDFIK